MQMNKKAAIYGVLLAACLIVTTVFFVLDIRIAFDISLAAVVVATFLMIKAGTQITFRNKESFLNRFQEAFNRHAGLYTFIIGYVILATIAVVPILAGVSWIQIALFILVFEASIFGGIYIGKRIKEKGTF